MLLTAIFFAAFLGLKRNGLSKNAVNKMHIYPLKSIRGKQTVINKLLIIVNS